MELQGKITHILPEQSGQGKNGVWRKQEFVVEVPGQYPKKVCFVVWGEKIDQFGIQMGDQVNVGIDIESREYNGKWYTDVKAWKVDKGVGGAAAPAQSSGPQNQSDRPIPQPIEDFSDAGDEDLPF